MVDDDALDSCAPLHLVQFCFDASEIQIDGSSKAAGPRTTPARPGRLALAQQDPPAAIAAAVPLLHDSTRPQHHSPEGETRTTRGAPRPAVTDAGAERPIHRISTM